MLAVKDHLTIAVEVETGKSDILANLHKCLSAPLDRLIFAPTNQSAKDKIESHLKQAKLQDRAVSVIEARYFNARFSH